MIEQINSLLSGFDELEKQISDPNIMSDQKRYTELLRKHKAMKPVVELGRKYLALEGEIEEYHSIIQSKEDPELVEIAREELPSLIEAKEELSEELKIAMLPKDSDAARNIIAEIRAGTGGEEAALFASDLYRMYQRYCERHGYKVEVMNTHEASAGGLKEIIFSISGNEVFGRMKYESGVHRVQRVPATEASGRIHTSAASIAVLPEVEEVEVEINPNELKIDVFRSSGPGGQSVNTTDSAVRITHLPTGAVVTCQDEKSQHKNKAKALQVLRARLYQKQREEEEAKMAAQRRAQVSTGDRSAKIRTYNFPQGRVTDHRINLTLYRLNEIMDGDLDEIIEALVLDERNRKLQEVANDSFITP
ncbi:peptide chain release factor 1 [candidate division LCP-89 bacterium B3_LCP]|uniref:Peptide chain release factor 1 n=1 Tax=candidate division LCP-89 bacterium B3_LCP TaxID=2012998 RepID=A0A532V3Y6_UNCL8|nr:MAG: peptide chain release factor 1 [candidate division LCP-89 bacterium B3_LCP]